jgi:two-component system, OmpR family, response regulator
MRILLIEDEEKIAIAIKKVLEQETYAVDVVGTGVDGLDMATIEDYDLIILDRMLPDMDGKDVCTSLRNNGKHTPLIMLTAKRQLQDKIDGLDAGADDYLVKPFAFEELLARIRSLIRRPKESLHTILSTVDLEMDTQTFEVRRNNTPIRLSSREFALLTYLLRHKNRIVSKDQIISNVWNYDADVVANTVEVYISNLRKKIDLGFPDLPRLIHTVKGFGYKIGEKK